MGGGDINATPCTSNKYTNTWNFVNRTNIITLKREHKLFQVNTYIKYYTKLWVSMFKDIDRPWHAAQQWLECEHHSWFGELCHRWYQAWAATLEQTQQAAVSSLCLVQDMTPLLPPCPPRNTICNHTLNCLRIGFSLLAQYSNILNSFLLYSPHCIFIFSYS